MSKTRIYEARILGTNTLVYGELVEGRRQTFIVTRECPGAPPEKVYQVDPDTVKLVEE